MSKYEIVIGLEVHVQLNTASKIFCGCPTDSGSPANTNICPVCCGYPGVLPVFNAEVLELAVRVCLALGCKINPRIYFERKNYFYPDLPKDYQISQYKMPLGEHGSVELPSGKKIGVTRGHLEEDAGKLVHKENYSLVDFNRCGTPLMEIVSEPDIRSPQEAYDYLTYLKLILQYVGASDCDMEKGSLRCDANISLRVKSETKLGTKVELKNMNTFKGVREALEYEAQRQEAALENNEPIFQETRLWDADKGRSVVMRSKEEAHDYRYFPEPDLPDFSVGPEIVARQERFVGELPLARRARFLSQYGLSEPEADVLIAEKYMGDYFELCCKQWNEPKALCNWLLGPFLQLVYEQPDKLKSVKISPRNFVLVVKYFTDGKMNNLAAKKALSLSITTDRDIDEIVQAEGLVQVSDEGQLNEFVQAAIKENAKAVAEYLSGKEQAVMFLVGQVMKKSKGKANPKIVREMLQRAMK